MLNSINQNRAPVFKGPGKPAGNPQLIVLLDKQGILAATLAARKRIFAKAYEPFIANDPRQSASLHRKDFLREAMPDAAAMRLMANYWDDAAGQLAGHGFVGFFRTDRDTLGFVFEDQRGMRAMWTVDARTHGARRLGPTL